MRNGKNIPPTTINRDDTAAVCDGGSGEFAEVDNIGCTSTVYGIGIAGLRTCKSKDIGPRPTNHLVAAAAAYDRVFPDCTAPIQIVVPCPTKNHVIVAVPVE